MIKDREFKKLLHECKGYSMHSNGNAVEEGYKPDYTMRMGNDFIILESENSSSRKTFVGGMLKAAHFLQGERTGSLVFVIVPRRNTKAMTIALHLKKYFSWISEKTNLKEIYVIEASHYYNKPNVLALLSRNFKKCSYRVYRK